jgi:hypothetical protein
MLYFRVLRLRYLDGSVKRFSVISLSGDYSWAHDKQPMPGKFRALRTAPETPTRSD